MSKPKQFYLSLLISVAINISNVYAAADEDGQQNSSSSSSSSSSTASNQIHHHPRPIYVTPTCDPFNPVVSIKGLLTVHSKIATSHKTLLGLEPLYRRGLSGKGVRVGVIEFDTIPCTPSGLQGAIIELPETSYNYDTGGTHYMLVSQVIASQQPDGCGGYIGFAPNAQVILGTYVSLGIVDVVKRTIREGAVCLNFSISVEVARSGISVPSCYYFSLHPDLRKAFIKTKAEPTDDLVKAIRFALDMKIPVFLSGGNDREILGEHPFLTKLLEHCNYNPLLQIVFGWEPKEEVFEKDDVCFAKYSARGSAKYPYLSRFALSAPYNVQVMDIDIPNTFKDMASDIKSRMESVKDEEKDKVLEAQLKVAYLKAYEKKAIRFTQVNVQGTSFSAPALASMYALLHEYALSKGKLNSEDIMACMQGTAYMPVLEIGYGQEYAWFGSGIPNGGAAILVMDDIANARLCFERKDFHQTVELWKKIFATLRGFSRPGHVEEAIEACTKASEDCAVFLQSIVGYWPSVYPNHLQDRLQSFRFFVNEQSDEFFNQLSFIHANTKKPVFSYETLEYGLVKALNKKLRPYLIAIEHHERIKIWEESFLSNEIAAIPTTDNGEFFERNRGRALWRPYLDCIRNNVNEAIVRQNDKRFLEYLESCLATLSYTGNEEIKIPEDLQKEKEALLQQKDVIKELIRKVEASTGNAQ